jgi:hypothetical protein
MYCAAIAIKKSFTDIYPFKSYISVIAGLHGMFYVKLNVSENSKITPRALLLNEITP